MPDLLTEIRRFESWAANYPISERNGEWECAYNDWNRLYDAVLKFVDQSSFTSWSSQESRAILYAIARDNESEYLVREIRERDKALLIDLAEAALRIGEPDAKWQLAHELGELSDDPTRRDHLLLTFARDDNEYVRRRALGALVKTGSPMTEELALEAWARPDKAQQWARMMALRVLHQIGSPHLERLLSEAERDERSHHLRDYATRIRRGELET